MAPAVFFLVDGLGLSGKTKALVDLACGLDPARYRAVVCCFDREASPLADRLEQRGIPVYEVPCRRGLDPAVVVRLGLHLRALRPAVVHCYNPRPMLYGGLAARALGIRATVGTLSAFACQVPDRHYEFLPQRLFTTSSRNLLRNQVVSRLMQVLAVVSPTLGERFCRHSRIPVAKLCVVSYGVDVEPVRRISDGDAASFRRELHLLPEDVLIGSVGRLVEQKDYPTQLQAFAQAAAAEPHLTMVLVGDGPLRAPLEQLVAELGVADRVVFHGHSADVPRLLRGLDIFVLASKFEPYGVALLEAKAAGLPIVATNVNEIPELITQGESGLLVPPANPTAMAAAFVRLAREPALRSRLGTVALQQALQKHSLRAMLDGYQDLYDRLLTGAGRAVPD